jgi:hypothetical protein
MVLETVIVADPAGAGVCGPGRECQMAIEKRMLLSSSTHYFHGVSLGYFFLSPVANPPPSYLT